MGELEKELKSAHAVFYKRMKTRKKIKHHLKTLEQSNPEWASGEVALKVADAELASAKKHLVSVLTQIKEQASEGVKIHAIIETEKPIDVELDYFSVALDRIDPKQRLQLSK